ncbi:MAG: ABC transporter substrate-binding protein [Hyphomicrobiaceae bacterium]|nr:MAG: ABC transporter substrate-binding protein [Hyphomicrobiaceae bacterium]
MTAFAQAPKKGGTLNFAVIAEPPDYDCHASTTFALVHPIAPHYQTLLKFDGKEYPKIVGDVAQSWTVSPDGLTYTFKINPGIKFHDGTDLTSADVKATYDRIVKPPQGVVSIRQAYYADIAEITTPDPLTVVFKLKGPNASMLQSFASPYDCIYSAAKLKQNPVYPKTEIMGSGPFVFVEHVKGSHWLGKRNEAYFKKGLPYLDGYKAFFIKGPAVVNGMLGGQFDIEFRGRTPQERDQLLSKDKERWVVHEGTWVNNLMVIFNTQKKPFDDVRVRRALTMAIDRWAGAQSLQKISMLRFVGGVMRPGFAMALPESELVKLPGYSKNIEAARAEAKKLLKEAGVENLKFKLFNRNVPEPYSPAGIFVIDQWRRIGVTADHSQLETKAYLEGVRTGNFDVAIEFMADFFDDPTAQFSKYLTKKASPSGYSGHNDTKLDELYEKQRRAINVAERTKIVNEMERYALQQAYNVPILWWQRIIVHHKKIKGWYMTPSHYLWQDLSEVWLDQ